jgi:flagellar protein FlaI
MEEKVEDDKAIQSNAAVEEKTKTKKVWKLPLSSFFVKKEEPQPPKVVFRRIPENAELVETYPIQPPFSRVAIVSLPELGGAKAYYIEEAELEEAEELMLQKLTDIISREVEPSEGEIDPRTHIQKEAYRLAKKYGFSKKIAQESWPKILYYILRDLIGFGPIHVIMNDRMIEDLSVNGVDIPVYVWHRKYESMPTNLMIVDEETINNLIVKLTHLAQKHISTAFPILDAMLPGKDRIAATFRREVSPKGGSFTIRRFREEPFSIIDLVELGTLDEKIAAYFWLLIENRMTIAVIGGTGAGKTSTLNALASLVKPSMKIVTVEEIPELNLPHENWVQLVSRESYGLGMMKTGEVTLFDLVKTSLRYRPDYIVVGEIRGEEAFVLFQALATGHGGLTTLHADSLDYAIKRLTSPPMNVSETYVPLINVAAIQERVQLPNPKSELAFGRRLKEIVEIVDYEEYKPIAKWKPVDDTFKVDLKESDVLPKIALKHGVSVREALEEIERRAILIRSLLAKGVKKNEDVAKQITNYYLENNSKKTM